MSAVAIPAGLRALVVRMVKDEGDFLPHQEYLTHLEEWSTARAEARGFLWEVADQVARRLTSEAVHVFPVIISQDEARLRASDVPARTDRVAMSERSVHDWHEGKPNCGVE